MLSRAVFVRSCALADDVPIYTPASDGVDCMNWKV